MTVAIIGANGFIGTRLVEMFHLGGLHSVVPVVRRASGLALAARFALDWRIGDALDVTSLTKAITGCDAVVHVALGDPRQIKAMPEILCAAAAAARVSRVVYLSSASVHGQAPKPGTTEATPLHCRHEMDYNNAKVRGERSFFRGCARHRLDGYALRPGIVFGPRSRWISDLASDLRERRAWLLGDGRGICNTLYVDNLVSAVGQCLIARPETAGAYLVGDREQITWSDFYRGAARSFGLDEHAIHRLTFAPILKRTQQEKITRLVAGRAMQTMLPAIPARLKTLAKRLLTSEPASPDAWQLAEAPQPRITQELVLLQQCEWKLPSHRAALHLGYQPHVNFATAMQRSAAWLAFAEGNA